MAAVGPLAAVEAAPPAPPPLPPATDASAPLLGGARVADDEAPSSYAGEARRLVLLGSPLVVEEVVSYGSTIYALACVGRLGATPLAVFTLAHSLTNMTGNTVFNGLGGALETFCSQAHGAGNARMVGLTTMRAILISLVAFGPLLALYLFGLEAVLLALGQDPAIAASTSRYVMLYSPAVLLHAITLCFYRALIAQGALVRAPPQHAPSACTTTPPPSTHTPPTGAVMYVLASTCAMFAATPPLCWLLIFRLGWGLDGSAAAAVACEAVYLVAMLVAAAVHNAAQPPGERPWQSLQLGELFSGWLVFNKVALASLVMLALDWWLFDITQLFVGQLPQPDLQLAASGVLYNIIALAFMMPFGLVRVGVAHRRAGRGRAVYRSHTQHATTPQAFAVGTRVGNLMGASQPGAAKVAAEVGTALGMGVMAVVGAALLAAPRQIAGLLTTDSEVVELCARLMPPVAVLLLGEEGRLTCGVCVCAACMHAHMEQLRSTPTLPCARAANGGSAILAGVLRGMRRQKQGAVGNAVGNWLVGLPAELVLGFTLGGGLWGLWCGLALGTVVQTLVLAAMVLRSDWGHHARRARRLVSSMSTASMEAGGEAS